MNLYFTNAIGFSKPGVAIIKAISVSDAIHKISDFITEYPQYQLFKTEIVQGTESDEIDFTIFLKLLAKQSICDFNTDIYIIDTGGLNEDPPIGNGMYIS